MRPVVKIVCAGLAFLVAWPVLAFPPAPESAKEQKILFTSLNVPEKKLQIGIMNADGSKRTLLTKGDALEMDPALSPDGKRIAFVSIKEKEKKSELWLMNADGSGRKKLMDLPEKVLALSPSWSPDGKRIAFSQINPDNDADLGAEVMVMDADGNNAKSLAKGMMPAFSPDGKKILYALNKAGKMKFVPQLHVMDADGKNDKELLSSHSFMGSWSPDGKRIAYVGSEEGPKAKPHVYTCKADGSDPTQLTKGDDGEFGALWSADGKRIFFNRLKVDGPPKEGAIWVMDADGKNEKQVSKSDGADMLGGSALLILFRSAAAPAPPKP
jgi:Tol biopolymer transport system component